MDKWYKEGLKFKCQGCSHCCSIGPGYVWLSEEEINKIASFLKLPRDIFLKKYCLTAMGKISLKELLPSYDCIFLKDKKCSIYEVRPLQCRTFPFWKDVIASKKAWDKMGKTCPGIDAVDGRLYSQKEIDLLSEEN